VYETDHKLQWQQLFVCLGHAVAQMQTLPTAQSSIFAKL
jgi:hypothetical protein